VNETCSPKTFEQALTDLEAVVRELEEGKIGLEDALERYERGVGLLKHCYSLLRTAEQRIMKLTGLDAQGRPILEAFAAGAEEAPAAKAATTTRRQRDPEPLPHPDHPLFGQ
jgi:exodeoxyribonuclease VII small subunit